MLACKGRTYTLMKDRFIEVRILIIVFAVIWLSVSAHKVILRSSMNYVYLWLR